VGEGGDLEKRKTLLRLGGGLPYFIGSEGVFIGSAACFVLCT